ncbi:MAG: FkbM family methyltransferase [Syntrophobacteraceae bacterium]
MSDNYADALSKLFAATAFPENAFYIDRVFKNKRIIVYGAGESFHYFKEIVMRRCGYVPSLVLDRKFGENDTFEGVPARSPLSYEPSESEKRDGLVVVCLGNQSYVPEVIGSLKKLGFSRILHLMDIYEVHNPFDFPPALAESGFQFYQDRRERIESCLDILADDMSREVFLKCLATHMQRIPVPIPMRDRLEQYTPATIRLSRGYCRFLYCGVSVGEMASVFDRIGKVEELVCFEPDPNQFARLARYLSANHERIADRVTAMPCAVYNRDSIEPFTFSDTSFGSRIVTSGGNATVQSVAIDHVLPGFKPTFISMDIEGAELEALEGAQRTIRANRPDLAVCVYHAPDHLWEIPLYLHGLDLGYKFYLRNYTSFVSETVLYSTT